MTHDDPRNQQRDERIIQAARELAESRGYTRITRGEIARVAGIAPASVSNYGFSKPSQPQTGGSAMSRIREGLMTAAVENGWHRIVAQGLTDGHPVALGASARCKAAAVAALAVEAS